MWKRVPLSIVFVLTLLLFSNRAFAHYNLTGYHLVEKEDFRYYYWDCPSTYGSAIPNSWRPYIGLAALAWSSNSTKVELSSTLPGPNINNCIYRANFITEIAQADVYYSSDGNVISWFIMFNQSKSFYTDGSTKYDVKTVSLHEFGHILGLDDIGFSLLPDTRAHMMYYCYTGVKPLHPQDIAGMRFIYGP